VQFVAGVAACSFLGFVFTVGTGEASAAIVLRDMLSLSNLGSWIGWMFGGTIGACIGGATAAQDQSL
jgi:hypothetical protein